MKKIIPLTILIITLSFTKPMDAAEDKSIIYDYDGNVILIHRGLGQTLRSDMPFQPGDLLRTDVNGKADILMNQLAGVRFLGGSECSFVETKASSMHLKLESGQALVRLRSVPSGGEFILETPLATIQTRVPAQFSCKLEGEDEKSSMVVGVKKGNVEVRVKRPNVKIRTRPGYYVNGTAN